MRSNRWSIVGAGLLAGLVAALMMTLVMILVRLGLGVLPPAELIGDRFAPTIPVNRFIRLLSQMGGYNRAKQFGVSSILIGQLVLGTLAGLLYAGIVERGRRRTPERQWRFGISRAGWIFAATATVIAWVASVIMLWPVLGSSSHGFPRGTATAITMLGFAISYASYSLTLLWTYRVLTSREPLRQPTAVGSHAVGRRAVLAAGAGVGVAAVSGGLIRTLFRRATFGYDGTSYLGSSIQHIAPNDRFYVVTKNVIDPSIIRSVWRLEIGGLVDRPRSYTFEELSALAPTTQEATLSCISNGVGGGLLSNAAWKGVPLRDLLMAAGPKAGAVQVLCYGADSYSDTFSWEKAMEPETMVVYEMNGEPLPERHGFPTRLIVPGLFGEKNVKWVTRIDVIDYDGKGFYEQQGWGPNFEVQTQTRIDSPNLRQPVKVGAAVMLKGVSFAGTRGVAKVEVSTDDGKTWQDATLNPAGSRITWRLWSFTWQPMDVGEYVVIARTTDQMGGVQISKARGSVPQGSTGIQRFRVKVQA